MQTLRKEIVAVCGRDVEALKKRVEADMSTLDALSPFAVLRRGYGIVRKAPEGIIVKDAENLAVKDAVDVTLAVGSFQAQVTEIYGSGVRWQGKSLKRH